jgi:hypothetical protein
VLNEQKISSKKMHQMVDLLIECAEDSPNYQAQLNEIVEIDKEFLLLREHLSLARRYYKNLAKQIRVVKKLKSSMLAKQ